MSTGQNEKPIVERSEVIFNDFFQIKKDWLLLKDQIRFPYYVLHARPYAVMVLARTSDGKLIINKEYRHPTGELLLSCPGGTVHDHETFIDCAKRELLEETGYTAERFEKMGESFPFPGISSQKTIFFRAFNAVPSASPTLETAEILETNLYSPEELKKAILKNPLDGLLITALYFDQF